MASRHLHKSIQKRTYGAMKILLICVKIWTYQYAKDSFEGILLKMLNTLHRPIEDASHRNLINDLMHIVRFLDINLLNTAIYENAV